jgi:hypothetical protein
LDRNDQGYPKQSPLMGASVPQISIGEPIGMLRRSRQEDFSDCRRLAFSHRIRKLSSSCGISLTWKHAAARRCTGFNSVVERGARRICLMVNAWCESRRWDYAISGQIDALLLAPRACDGMPPSACNVRPLGQWRSDHCFDVSQGNAQDARTVGGGDHDQIAGCQHVARIGQVVPAANRIQPVLARLIVPERKAIRIRKN